MDPTAILQALLLGLLEGLTEFLPVSSTGHLILASELIGFSGEGSVAFKIAIQLGAILAVLVAYRDRFTRIAIGALRREPGAIAFVRNILLGFLPAMLVGVVAYSAIRALLESPMVVAVALIVGGFLILLIERLVKPRVPGTVEDMPWKTALGVGAVQCIAMIPGVSRSGATIVGAMLLGADRRAAAEFSFFLAIPTMLGAFVYDLYKSHGEMTMDHGLVVAVGFVVSFITAIIVVKTFLTYVTRHGFTLFAWWRVLVGTLGLIALAFGR